MPLLKSFCYMVLMNMMKAVERQLESKPLRVFSLLNYTNLGPNTGF